MYMLVFVLKYFSSHFVWCLYFMYLVTLTTDSLIKWLSSVSVANKRCRSRLRAARFLANAVCVQLQTLIGWYGRQSSRTRERKNVRNALWNTHALMWSTKALNVVNRTTSIWLIVCYFSYSPSWFRNETTYLKSQGVFEALMITLSHL